MFHYWGGKFKDHVVSLDCPGFFKAVQEDHTLGTYIEHVTERYRMFDIGLIKIDRVNFNNSFMDIEIEAKSLLSTKTIQYEDEFELNGYTIGK